MGPGANQDGDALRGTLLTHASGDIGDTRGFGFATSTAVQVHSSPSRSDLHRAGTTPDCAAFGRCVLNRPGCAIGFAQHLAEYPVVPVNQGRRGAEVHNSSRASSEGKLGVAPARILEKSDLGFAKAVDRLHGIADEE